MWDQVYWLIPQCYSKFDIILGYILYCGIARTQLKHFNAVTSTPQQCLFKNARISRLTILTVRVAVLVYPPFLETKSPSSLLVYKFLALTCSCVLQTSPWQATWLRAHFFLVTSLCVFWWKKGCSQNLCIFMLDSQFGASMMRSPLSVFKLKKKRHIPVKLLMFQLASLLLKPSGFVDDVRIWQI